MTSGVISPAKFVFSICHRAHIDLYRVYTGSCPAWYRTLRPHTVLACLSHRVLTVSSPCAYRFLWNMYCCSKISIAALKYLLLLWNMYCRSEICIDAPKYILSLRKCYPDGMHTLCSCHMAPAKPTVCHRVVNFVRTVEHGEGTRRGVERSVNTLVAR